jgi:hypothetical protein
VVRVLRILRPLRFITHNPQMKMIVSALLDSGGAILNVAVVILVVWLMFAILAINLFAGKFFYCSINPYLHHSRLDCEHAGGVWSRFYTNFDDIIQAMKSLFILAEQESWTSIMYSAIDTTNPDQGPQFQNHMAYGYFFIVFIFVGSMFFMNFLIGILFLKYTQAQNAELKGMT